LDGKRIDAPSNDVAHESTRERIEAPLSIATRVATG
jgi:hypothetical protein